MEVRYLIRPLLVGVLFRKDLEHEGLELKRGEKHVITANLWAVRKEVSKQVLLVNFPGE